ncbi:DUF4363 family protein [Clostridium brassicae]|uniref:DUF4363 family protein n=1 Tax=Clostridium brassicae TaxID=2999072 RepID=A0ABT4D9F4_9CLOT|nr:DUF4363 family protein [Clostridium brassicae]MCY6958934.1 DUF4363 family protein [Clostridium brassicae]
MKNVIASFTIFIFLIFSIVFSINYVEKTCNFYKIEASNLENVLINNDWENAYELSNTFLDNWKKDSKIIAIFVDHNHIDTVYTEALKLTQYTKCKDKSNSLASVHTLKFLMDDIVNFEKLTIQNIF